MYYFMSQLPSCVHSPFLQDVRAILTVTASILCPLSIPAGCLGNTYCHSINHVSTVYSCRVSMYYLLSQLPFCVHSPFLQGIKVILTITVLITCPLSIPVGCLGNTYCYSFLYLVSTVYSCRWRCRPPCSTHHTDTSLVILPNHNTYHHSFLYLVSTVRSCRWPCRLPCNTHHTDTSLPLHCRICAY